MSPKLHLEMHICVTLLLEHHRAVFPSLMSPATLSLMVSPEASSDFGTCVLTAFYAFKSQIPTDCHFSRTEMWAHREWLDRLYYCFAVMHLENSPQNWPFFFSCLHRAARSLSLTFFFLWQYRSSWQALQKGGREGREGDSLSQHGGFCLSVRTGSA